MIALIWYNIVAIVVGFVAIMCCFVIPKPKIGGWGLDSIVWWTIWLLTFGTFYSIWGKIFWG